MTCSGFSLGLFSLIRPTAIFHIVDGPSPRGYHGYGGGGGGGDGGKRASSSSQISLSGAAVELFLFSVLETMLYFIVHTQTHTYSKYTYTDVG